MVPSSPQSSSAPSTSRTPMSAPHFIGAVEDNWRLFSDNPDDYTIGSPIGFGASSIVYAATYTEPCPNSTDSLTTPCALKVLDLDSLPPHSLSLLQRETTLMSLSKHPNVLRVRGSWMEGHKLYIALRLMNKGSAADVMHYGWPGGLDENVILCILRQTLQGLNYLHVNGFIHRDVKAANLLIDEDGTVLLGDLGVAADLSEDPSHHPVPIQSTNKKVSAVSALSATQPDSMTVHPTTHSTLSAKHIRLVDPVQARRTLNLRKRKSFVGRPCWMAPELIEGKRYAAHVDIWSFGITALELAQGRPPRSRSSPQQVLLQTIQDPAPKLDRDNGVHKYSRAFQEMIESCLVKDPSQRPSAAQLLQLPIFKTAKKKGYLVSAILKELPPLAQRQQRRALSNALSTRASIDSWDFATTVHSTHRRFLDRSSTDNASDDLQLESGSRRTSVLSQTRPMSIRRPSQIDASLHEQEADLLEGIPSSMSDVAASPPMTAESTPSSPPTSISELGGSASSPPVSPWKPSSVPASSTSPIPIRGTQGHGNAKEGAAVSTSVSSKLERKTTGVWKKLKDATKRSNKQSL